MKTKSEIMIYGGRETSMLERSHSIYKRCDKCYYKSSNGEYCYIRYNPKSDCIKFTKK